MLYAMIAIGALAWVIVGAVGATMFFVRGLSRTPMRELNDA